MIDYQILALDLDGTLTNSQKQITPPTREASDCRQSPSFWRRLSIFSLTWPFQMV